MKAEFPNAFGIDPISLSLTLIEETHFKGNWIYCRNMLFSISNAQVFKETSNLATIAQEKS